MGEMHRFSKILAERDICLAVNCMVDMCRYCSLILMLVMTRSLVQISLRIYLIFLAALGPGVYSASNRNEYHYILFPVLISVRGPQGPGWPEGLGKSEGLYVGSCHDQH
jgi:hypothetical protein